MIGKFNIRIAVIEKISERIIRAELKDANPIANKKDAVEFANALLKLSENKPYLLLTDITKVAYTNWTTEAKEYIAEHPDLNKLCKYNAVVINSFPIKLLFQLYISFFKPKTKTKTFDSVARAMSILRRKEKIFFS